jgi:hypothetical protein
LKQLEDARQQLHTAKVAKEATLLLILGANAEVQVPKDENLVKICESRLLFATANYELKLVIE